MKTIPEILDLALESIDNLPDAIMRCKVLADGLGHQGFQEWVNLELYGYPDLKLVPEYRRVRGRVEAIASGSGSIQRTTTCLRRH